MKSSIKVSRFIFVCLLFAFSGCATQIEKEDVSTTDATTVGTTKPKEKTNKESKEKTNKKSKEKANKKQKNSKKKKKIKTAYLGKGKASFYSNKFRNRRTASGERFKQSKLTAAHRKLPFGTKVKVTNIKNGKSVIVRINDRGPFIRGRVIDLSRSAFKKIGHTRSGVIRVKLEIVK